MSSEWKVEDVIAKKLKLKTQIVENVICLLKADNTVPFIALYRKEETGNMDPEILRYIKYNHLHLLAVKKKIMSVVSSISKMDKMTPLIMNSLQSSQTMSDIEDIYAQVKQSRSTTLAERARNLGLEPAAMAVLHGTDHVTPEQLVNEKTESASQVMKSIQHIIADVVSKNGKVWDTLRNLCVMNKKHISIETKRRAERPSNSDKPKKGIAKKDVDSETFKIFFSFRSRVSKMKPYQVFAIKEGEALKCLDVKITLPEIFKKKFTSVCHKEWQCKGLQSSFREEIFNKSVQDAFTRLLKPRMIRYIRSHLEENAHLSCIQDFAKNLNELFLTPPVWGEVILGIYPGYREGCKLAVVNTNGEVLQTKVIFTNHESAKEEGKKIIHSLLFKYKCNLIALGNGRASRETEKWISSLISSGYFNPLYVECKIVNSQGVDAYSFSPVAKQEFPNMGPNLICAVSVARRLQDPLRELTKLSPSNLCEGAHFLSKEKFSSILNELVMECVSFVGVDINTASKTLLCHISGLNAIKAASIVDWRSKNGPFVNRDQLHLVEGIGPKYFQQCAGFLRIISARTSHPCFGDLKGSGASSESKIKDNVLREKTPNPLDQTWIHPELYSVVYRFLEFCGISLAEFGNTRYFRKISEVDKKGILKFARQAHVSEEILEFLLEGLKQYPFITSQFQVPLFQIRSSVNDLEVGANLIGRVNETKKCCVLIDIGIGRNVPVYNIEASVGYLIEVTIKDIDKTSNKPKINLGVVRIL